MSFPPHQKDPFPTDLPYRGTLLSAIYADFKNEPKNSSNVQPVVL